MTRIIAYTYDADVHCIDCTRKRHSLWALQRKYPGIYVKADGDHLVAVDEHGVADYSCDSEGHAIHPVFTTDEHDFTYCGDCCKELE